MTADLLAVVFRVSEILEGLGVPYLVVGSIASSIMGEPRTSEDADFVVAVK